MMSSMSGFRGDVMAEGSRLQPMGAHFRDAGSSLSRDYCMDSQPLDYSTKRIHGLPLSLTSIDNGGSLAGDNSTTPIFKSPKLSPKSVSESLSLRSECSSPMSCSPAPHATPYSQVHGRSYSPTPHAFQQLLHPPPPPPVPPAAQISPSALPPLASSFHHNPTAVSSLILAQLQANPLLFSTLLAKSNLMTQQQQLQNMKAQVSPPLKSPPSEPRLPGFSAAGFGVGGLGPDALGMMHLKNYHGDHLGPTPGVLHNNTQEEFALMERSNEEYRSFRENFLTESSKMKARRGGRRNSTTLGGASVNCDRSGGAPDDSGGEGSIDVVSGDSGDGEDQDAKIDNGEENNVEMSQQEAGADPYTLTPKRRHNRQGLENTTKDEAYWERRRRNNEAAKRSRDARRAKEEEIAIRGAFLEQENMKLRAELSTLKSETAKLRCMLYNS
ncbi:Cell death specification protein 2 [Portunus trituberculatus]|uniref:Cell death specification protein 2 n=1 Tax=Portunus trituberculatus TaxID=210409 RepID=A0A5B7IBR0_PORTR|nr:Cell death specification protein 2 [Portunus trituberculatus]